MEEKFLNFSRLGGVALTRYMDRRTDGQGDSYIPPKTLFAGGMKRIKGYKERGMIRLQNVDSNL